MPFDTILSETLTSKLAISNYIVGNHIVGKNGMMRKGGSNWVDGDNFFDREAELETLSERVREGTHTMLTA